MIPSPEKVDEKGVIISQRITKRQEDLNKTFVYYAAFVILGLAAAAIGPTLQGLAVHVRSTMSQISYLFVLRSLGYLIGSLIAGRVYDRSKGHPVMAFVILCMATFMAIVPIISELWLLASILLMIGIAEGVLDVGGNTLLVWLHREKMGPYMNGLHFFFGLGAFISPVIIAQTVFYSGDINWSYWVLALLMLPSAIWLLRIPSPPSIVTSPSISIRQVLPILIILLSVFDFLYVGAEVAFGSWIYTYATSMGLGTKVTGAYLTSVFWGALTVGRLASIPIAKRFSPQIIIFIDLIILLTSLAMIIRSDVSNQVFALWVGTFGVGLGMASIFPTILTLAGKYMTITGYVTSWFFVGSSLGGMILPWIVGQLFDFAGPQVIMLVIFASIIIEMILFFGIMLYIKRLNKTY